jgi:hypothetical protein
MKTINRRLDSLCFCRFGSCTAWIWSLLLLTVATEAEGQFTFTTNNGVITITGYTGSGGTVVIPSTTNGLPVGSIGTSAFGFNTSVTNVAMPNSVTNIGDFAFDGCSNLMSATLPSSVTTIGEAAFAGTGLTSATIPNSVSSVGFAAFGFTGLTNITITIPESVTNVGGPPFEACYPITAIKVASNNPSYTSTAGVLFNKNQTALIEYPGGKAGPYTIPSGVTSVGDDAFAYCPNLTSITIPSSVTNIGKGAFAYCTSLTTVTIPGSVTTIGYTAFDDCTNLTEADFEGNAPTIEAPLGRIPFVFEGDNLATLYFIPGTTGWGTAFGGLVPEAAFNFMTNNGTITITSGNSGFSGALVISSTLFGLPVTSIAETAFFEGTLASVTIPSTVTNIGFEAFDDCTNLTAINLDAQNPAYSTLAGVLFDKSQRNLIQYPVGNAAASYTIPNGVTNIGTFAFRDCSSLTSVTIPNGVTGIGPSAFDSCTSLTNVNIPNTLTTIASSVFDNCSSLAGVTIPNSVTSIGPDAFEFCTNFTTITVPGSVTNIALQAFSYCYNLTGIYFRGNAPTAAPTAFFYTTNAIIYYVPGTTGWGTTLGGLKTGPAFYYTTKYNTIAITTGNTNFCWALAIPSTVFGVPVISIEDYAFAETSLTSVTIPDTVTSIGTAPFLDCSNLAAINVDSHNPAYCSVGGVLFNKTQTTLIQYPAGKVGTSYTIPNPVASIADYAFAGCDNLTSVMFGNAVITIGDYGFFSCINLTSLTLPNSITTIGDRAVASCPNLVSVTIPNTVTSIGSDAFAGCTSLTSVTIPDGVTGTIGGFGRNYGLTNVIIGNGVTEIESGAFDTCTNLASVKIGNSVTNIGASAFDNCSMATIFIPNSVTAIGLSAFIFCHDLTTVTIGKGVTNVGNQAFYFDKKLTSVFFQGNAPTLGLNVFFDDSATVFYLPGTTGWDSFNTNSGLNPAVLWNPQAQVGGASFGVKNHKFGFIVTGTTNIPIVVEACTNLVSSSWTSLQNCTLTNGSIYFSDPNWTNGAARFYRIRSP